MGSSYEDVGVFSIYAATAPERGGELSGVLCDQIMSAWQKIFTILNSNVLRNQQKAELLMATREPADRCLVDRRASDHVQGILQRKRDIQTRIDGAKKRYYQTRRRYRRRQADHHRPGDVSSIAQPTTA